MSRAVEQINVETNEILDPDGWVVDDHLSLLQTDSNKVT